MQKSFGQVINGAATAAPATAAPATAAPATAAPVEEAPQQEAVSQAAAPAAAPIAVQAAPQQETAMATGGGVNPYVQGISAEHQSGGMGGFLGLAQGTSKVIAEGKVPPNNFYTGNITLGTSLQVIPLLIRGSYYTKVAGEKYPKRFYNKLEAMNSSVEGEVKPGAMVRLLVVLNGPLEGHDCWEFNGVHYLPLTFEAKAGSCGNIVPPIMANLGARGEHAAPCEVTWQWDVKKVERGEDIWMTPEPKILKNNDPELSEWIKSKIQP